MELFIILYTIVLFYCLTPGILFTFPKKGKYLIALTHSVLFAILFDATRKWINNLLYEGFQTQNVGEACLRHDDCSSKFCSGCDGSTCSGTKRGVCLANSNLPVDAPCLNHDSCSTKFCSSCNGSDCSKNTSIGKCSATSNLPVDAPCLIDTQCQSGWCSVCYGTRCNSGLKVPPEATGKCLKRTDYTAPKPGTIPSFGSPFYSNDLYLDKSNCVLDADCASNACGPHKKDPLTGYLTGCNSVPPSNLTNPIAYWNSSSAGYKNGCQEFNTKFAKKNGKCFPIPENSQCSSSLGCYTAYCKNGKCARPEGPGLGLPTSPCAQNSDCKSNSCLNIKNQAPNGYLLSGKINGKNINSPATGPPKSATYGFCK